MAVALPAVLHAHAGRPPEPHDLWTEWRVPLVLLAVLALATAGYARGVRTVWARGGTGAGISRAQAAAFGGAMASLLVALGSPLDLVSSALFSAHMVQHLVLVLVSGPLLAIARPEVAFLWAIPTSGRRAIGRWWVRRRWLRAAWNTVSHPLAAWTIHAGALWAWHAPVLYDAAARTEALHLLEHGTFVATAVLFARPLVGAVGASTRRLSPGAAAMYLFAAAMQSGILGALLTLSGSVWYSAHLASTGPWGLTPLEDQQIAGALMWGPAGGAYLAGILWAMHGWLTDPQPRRDRRADAAGARVSVAAETAAHR